MRDEGGGISGGGEGVGAGRLFEAESGFDLAGGVGAFAFVDGAGLEKVEVVVEVFHFLTHFPDLLEDAGLLFLELCRCLNHTRLSDGRSSV